MSLTHEERMEKARELNRQIAAGKKAGIITTSELIRSDSITAEEIAELVDLYPVWRAGATYKVGDLMAYNGTIYEVIQPHTSQSDWKPDGLPALYKSKAPAAVIPEWKQPAGGHDAYQKGDKVMFGGKVYESLIDANVWSPTGYPAGWQMIP